MKIQNVADDAFRRYGKVLEGYDFTELLKEMKNTPVPEDGAGDGVGGTVENRVDSTEPENTAAPNGDNASGLTDGNANGNVNDITDDSNVNDATDNGTGVGGAAKDIVDGVGDAGKDLIDGVEDAGDALAGEEPADTAR